MRAASARTPGGHAFDMPPALAAAVAGEWEGKKRFSLSAMPLTSLAYTALDRIRGQEPAIVEALLVYIDTDTLSYRSSEGRAYERQLAQWDPVLEWLRGMLGAGWETTRDIMPVEQPPELHRAVRTYLERMDAFELAAFSVLASGLSSLALAIALAQGRLTADEAFILSRLEEEVQAEQWGRDAQAEARALRLHGEILTAYRFLRLLKAE